MEIRIANLDDLKACLLIQKLAHRAEHLESEATFAFFLASGTSLVGLQDGHLIAYALTYPWNGIDWPCLGAMAISEGTEQWWHDMAIDPQFQGQGLVREFIEHILFRAPSTGGIALAHVAHWWMTKGFKCVDRRIDPAYGLGAQALIFRRPTKLL